MIARLALRDRLALTFAIALVAAYALIAVTAVTIVQRAVSASIDGRLRTVAEATRLIAGDGNDEIDRKDRRQFASISAEATGALVLDAKGTLLLGSIPDIPTWVRPAIKAVSPGSVFEANDDGRTVRAIVVTYHEHDSASHTVVVWESMRIVSDLEHIIILVLAGCGLAVAAGGYAIGALIARGGLAPLRRIAAVVADIAAHDLSRRLGPQAHDDEIGRLAATFDRMLDRLESAFDRQRRFTADASHDLRAPLATLRAEVDLALRRDRTNDEYRSALEAIAADADQLDRLIDALLAAARSEDGDIVRHSVDLGTVARASIEQIAAFAQSRDVHIDAGLDERVIIGADAALLERAVLATLHNAVKFTRPHGTIHVAVNGNATEAELCIQDEGPGFTQAALVHAFDRFWRDDTARGRSGSGLGLAIARAIVAGAGGDITIANHPGGGAEVFIRFPLLVREHELHVP